VDGKAETAMGGAWRKGPGEELFKVRKARNPVSGTSSCHFTPVIERLEF